MKPEADRQNSGRLLTYIIKGPGQQITLALVALIALYLFFGIFGRHFLSFDTLISILDASYSTAFMAVGMTFVVISAGIDLSVGTVTVGAALVGGVAYNNGICQCGSVSS